MSTNINTLENSRSDRKTMSSREIADLTGKDLKHVHRDIKKMFEQLEVDGPDLDHLVERDARGYISQYNLPRRECEILITGYDVKRRAAVIDRWLDLETRLTKTQEELFSLIKKSQEDKDVASMCGRLLSCYKKIKKENNAALEESLKLVQGELKF